MAEKNKGISPDPKRPHLFGPGNQSGGGRKVGSLTSKRARLTNLFVDKADKELPEIIDTVLKLAKEGNMKAIDIVASYCFTRPVTIHNIETQEEIKLNQATKDVLLSIVANEQESV